jgi:hypothetical protein
MNINMINTHGLEWDSGNGLEGGSPPGLCYGYIDSEMIIEHVILVITNSAILVAVVAL